jgi:hypothetical protein
LGGTPPTPRELETNRFLYDRTAAVLGIIVGFINLVFLIK